MGREMEAARLWGAAVALRASIGIVLPVLGRARFEERVAAARARSDAAAFEAAWAEGQAMPPEEALVYALGVSSSGHSPLAGSGVAGA
jgi:hypothetical protein